MPSQPSAEAIGNPNVPLAVNGKTAIVDPGLEILGLARISGREARDMIDTAIGHPNPVLLVDAEVKWRSKRFARLRAVALANDPAVRQIALGKVDELALLNAQHPNVSARSDDNALHQPSLPSNVIPSGGVRGLPFLSKTVIDLLP